MARPPRSRPALAALLLLALSGCTCGGGSDPGTTGLRPPQAPPVVLEVVYGSEKKTWLEEEARRFLAGGPRTGSGRAIQLKLRAMGSGEALNAIARGEARPHVYSPASSAYLPLLDRAWMEAGGRTRRVVAGAEPLVLSPVVVAMWKPMAEALGWPAKRLGWRDLLAVHGTGKGWSAYGRPEWGDFKLGHTHPEYSNSGLLSVLAEAYAGAGKTRGLTAEDVRARTTRAFIQKVEATVVHYGQSTGFFAEKMLARGPGYLSAAVLYENLVIESYASARPPPLPLVAIYPVEGTFWSDHPWALLDADWVGPEEREAAKAVLAHLRSRPAQERALALGFRPADPAIPVGAPVDAGHGVDARQPQTLLEVPDAPVLEALLEVWREVKKAADVVLVFDKSGSMEGEPLREAVAGAKAFLDTLSPRDRVTLLFFDQAVHAPVGPVAVGEGRDMLAGRIEQVVAGGGTALHDATWAALQRAAASAAREPGRIHAVVVMTDGRDEHSKMGFAELRAKLGSGEQAASVRVFTIAYGPRAQKELLAEIAEAAQGKSATGSAENIVAVYREMGAFF